MERVGDLHFEGGGRDFPSAFCLDDVLNWQNRLSHCFSCSLRCVCVLCKCQQSAADVYINGILPPTFQLGEGKVRTRRRSNTSCCSSSTNVASPCFSAGVNYDGWFGSLWTQFSSQSLSRWISREVLLAGSDSAAKTRRAVQREKW